MFVANGEFLEKVFLVKEVSGRTVQLDEIEIFVIKSEWRNVGSSSGVSHCG
jgi:hypothetical protein